MLYKSSIKNCITNYFYKAKCFIIKISILLQVIRRLSNDIFPSDKMSERTLPGKGNAHTKVLTFQNAIELVMVLPGEVAKGTRKQFSDVIKRYIAGDASLVPEIQANAQSASPIAQMAREYEASCAASVSANELGPMFCPVCFSF